MIMLQVLELHGGCLRPSSFPHAHIWYWDPCLFFYWGYLEKIMGSSLPAWPFVISGLVWIPWLKAFGQRPWIGGLWPWVGGPWPWVGDPWPWVAAVWGTLARRLIETKYRRLQGRCPAYPHTNHLKASRARVPMTLWCGSDLFSLHSSSCTATCAASCLATRARLLTHLSSCLMLLSFPALPLYCIKKKREALVCLPGPLNCGLTVSP